MAKNLVIVESPAKAKTIESYLGKDYKVTSSFGHIRDLPSNKMSVDIEGDFSPTYVVPDNKKKVVSQIKKNLTAGTTVWLATDEDREGEAIAWHLQETLGLKPANIKRITFHEITKPAILAAVENPRKIDKNRVDAQQARRVLDRLVGYEISPVLWKKIKPGLSAGRVQSVAVRLIVEREKEIQNFKPERSFKLSARLKADSKEFEASYANDIPDIKQAHKLLENLKKSKLNVGSIDQSEGKRNPPPPFTTSTLQQTASQRLGYSVRQTMRLAQNLYESGAITYMRTDSVNLSDQALAAAQSHIDHKFGKKYYQRRTFATKSKGAQEAHEAIRPTDPGKTQASKDQRAQKLYELIRGRFLASQMTPAKLLRTIVSIIGDGVELEANGEVIVFDGWLKAYPQSNIKDNELPQLKAGQLVQLISALAQESLVKAPARFSEATLVRHLENMGIGRPSTYAPTISTIQDRGYIVHGEAPVYEVELSKVTLERGKIAEVTEKKTLGGEKRKLLPTDIAFVVTDFLTKQFKNIVDYDFTANVEEEFDDIASGKKQWNKMITEFYKPFHKEVAAAEKVDKKQASPQRVLGKDPKTRQPVIARLGRYGPMLQRGETEDESIKPEFAPLPSGSTLQTITLEQALPMFELPRTLGQLDGQEVKANIGRFGPYVQLGKTFASIPEDIDVFKINLDQATKLLKERVKKQKNRVIADYGKIKILNGRYGPYITDGKTNVKVPKDSDPTKITEKDAIELIKNKV